MSKVQSMAPDAFAKAIAACLFSFPDSNVAKIKRVLAHNPTLPSGSDKFAAALELMMQESCVESTRIGGEVYYRLTWTGQVFFFGRDGIRLDDGGRGDA